MATYGNKSQAELNTAHADLITLFNEVILHFDNAVIYGHRTPYVQFELFKKGRTLINGVWIVTDPGRVVTYKDGISKLSKHNPNPSLAVDVTPYPINWKDTDRMRYFAGFVMGIALKLKQEGKINHEIRWGGDWDQDTEVGDETFLDLVHFEIVQ